MRWVLLVALAWLAVFALFAVAVQQSARSHSESRDSWAVIHATSAHRLLVINVEASRPEDARQIAAEIVDPLRGQYTEVLIYVRPARPASMLHARRIQWTPQSGFVETAF